MSDGQKDYLGAKDEFQYEELDSRELEKTFDPRLVTTAFRTLERSLDTNALAESLRAAISASEKVRFREDSEVLAVERQGSGFRVDHRGNHGPGSCEFDQVVNALWDGRLLIDTGMGYPPRRKWLHRFKYGITVHGIDKDHHMPSIAVTCGPFGDIVSYPNGNIFLSWYSDCMAEVSGELAPPKLPQVPSLSDGRRIFKNSWEALSAICPPLGRLGTVDESQVSIRGGIILAWGECDIGRPESELHVRHEVGPFSDEGYHSVDTGKYTLAPMYALEVAESVCASS